MWGVLAETKGGRGDRACGGKQRKFSVPTRCQAGAVRAGGTGHERGSARMGAHAHTLNLCVPSSPFSSGRSEEETKGDEEEKVRAARPTAGSPQSHHWPPVLKSRFSAPPSLSPPARTLKVRAGTADRKFVEG